MFIINSAFKYFIINYNKINMYKVSTQIIGIYLYNNELYIYYIIFFTLKLKITYYILHFLH